MYAWESMWAIGRRVRWWERECIATGIRETIQWCSSKKGREKSVNAKWQYKWNKNEVEMKRKMMSDIILKREEVSLSVTCKKAENPCWKLRALLTLDICYQSTKLICVEGCWGMRRAMRYKRYKHWMLNYDDANQCTVRLDSDGVLRATHWILFPFTST